MSAPARRCSTSSEACVRRCRKATSRAKRMRWTRRSRRLRKNTDRRSRLRLPFRRPRRRPRRWPESRTRRLRRPLRPLPQDSPLSSGPLRLRRRGLRLDRLRKREPQANPEQHRRPFQARRSGLLRRRRNGARRRGTRRKRQLRWRGDPRRWGRRSLRPLDPSWLLQWPISLPPDRGPPGRLHPSRQKAARMRVCPEWRR